MCANIMYVTICSKLSNRVTAKDINRQIERLQKLQYPQVLKRNIKSFDKLKSDVDTIATILEKAAQRREVDSMRKGLEKIDLGNVTKHDERLGDHIIVDPQSKKMKPRRQVIQRGIEKISNAIKTSEQYDIITLTDKYLGIDGPEYDGVFRRREARRTFIGIVSRRVD